MFENEYFKAIFRFKSESGSIASKNVELVTFPT